MNLENEAVIKDIVGGLRWLVRAVYQDSAGTGKRFGLTVAQSGVLRNLAIHGPLSSADLSRKLYVTPANITGIVDRLEKKGLVERVRQAADRRVSLISLTESGQKLGESLPDPIENKLIAGLAGLDHSRIKELADAIDLIRTLVDIDVWDDLDDDSP